MIDLKLIFSLVLLIFLINYLIIFFEAVICKGLHH